MANVKRRCFQCSKIMLYIVNILFWMLGAALLGLGVWLHFTNGNTLTIAPGYRLLMPAALFIATGVLSVIVGFLGCCGAITENKCMIISYCVLMLMVIVLEMSGSIAALSGSLHMTAHEQIENQLVLSLKERYPGDRATEKFEKDVVTGWDSLQKQFLCCGVNGYLDWYKSHGWPSEDRVPDSCCKVWSPGCGLLKSPDKWYSKGCSEATSKFVERHVNTVAITTMVFAVIQILTIAGAAIFMRFHKKHKEIR